MLFLKEILARQTLKLDCIKNPKYSSHLVKSAP